MMEMDWTEFLISQTCRPMLSSGFGDRRIAANIKLAR